MLNLLKIDRPKSDNPDRATDPNKSSKIKICKTLLKNPESLMLEQPCTDEQASQVPIPEINFIAVTN